MEKKMLSVRDIESQTALELPDRELMGHHGWLVLKGLKVDVSVLENFLNHSSLLTGDILSYNNIGNGTELDVNIYAPIDINGNTINAVCVAVQKLASTCSGGTGS